MKHKLSFISLSLFIAALATAALFPLATAQAGTNVKGLITSDTVWTQAGSPYNITGPTAVNDGVTLTIQPGATVNLNGYYIRVNGTLTAKGTQTDKITFNGGQLVFTTVSNGWNEQTQSGCIIQNAIMNQLSIANSNPIKIDSSTIDGGISVASAGTISNCIIIGDVSVTSSATITNCRVTGNIHSLMSTISNNNIKGDITLGSVTLGGFTTAEESSVVSGNTVEGSINSGSPKGVPRILNNNVSKGGIGCTGYGFISNNHVHGCQTGISLFSQRVFGGKLACFATVENNIVVDNTYGIRVDLESLGSHGTLVPTIQKNTIARNSIGMSVMKENYDAPTIRYNNLQDNAQYNFYLITSDNVDVSLNWWGTTNESAISQSIYDSKNDFNLGTVTFQPILTSPNANAPTPPLPTPTPSPLPSPTPTVPEFSATTLVIMLVAILAAVTLYRSKHKPRYFKD